MNRNEARWEAPERGRAAPKEIGGSCGVSILLGDILSAITETGAQPAPATEGLRCHLNHLGGKLELILAEHEGMGNELLQAYEQLGIVFDITRRLASVTDEGEVMGTFIACLRAMFDRCCFVTARYDAGGELRFCFWNAEEFATERTIGLTELVGESAAARRVTVRECAAASAAEDGPRGPKPAAHQAMACPIYAGQDFVCALVLIRGAGFREFTSADMLLMDALSVFCGDIIRNRRLMHELRQMSIDMVRALVETIDQKDGYTSGHSNRVAHYARLLAQELGWSDERLQILEWAALLHDVGKIGIRDDVLNKTGKLTPEEFEHMKEHPVRSSEVVCQVPQLAEALDGVLHHHEHWDGRGYPDGLTGEDIPLQARVIQTADIFDALTTSRAYRKAFTWQEALSILREEAGVVVDPNLAMVFERILRKWEADDPEKFDQMFEANARSGGVSPERVGRAQPAVRGPGSRVQGQKSRVSILASHVQCSQPAKPGGP
ncbi:MAG: HD-GYP domain-containing protein [Planctomycetota bacterium]